MPHQLLPYFPAATFFQKFQGSGLYSGAAYVRTFPKKPRTTHCMLCRASISTWSRSAHPQYSAITVSAAVWPPLPNSPSLSLSLCLCMRGVSFQWQSTALEYVAVVYCTHRQSVGKLPPEVPCWAHSSGHQVAAVISRSARLNALRRTLTQTRQTTNPLHGALSGCLGLADFRPRY